MTEIVKLLRQGRTEEVWQRCCGFIDLSLEDFMKIQRRLLSEQLELLKRCELGRYLMNGANPRNVEELRERLPRTTYDNYAPYLLEQRADVLPKKPALWQYTSGKSGEYPFRWVPVTTEQLREIETIGEKPLTGQISPGLLKKAEAIPRLKNRIRKTIFVTLKNG